jgi:hypothetical protein
MAQLVAMIATRPTIRNFTLIDRMILSCPTQILLSFVLDACDTHSGSRYSHYGTSKADGSNTALLVAWITTTPTTGSEILRDTVTLTVLVAQDRSTGQSQRTRRAPFALAKRAASFLGEPRAPNGRNVTGALASAAASAALAAAA